LPCDQTNSKVVDAPRCGFNPVLGFYCPATNLRPTNVTPTEMFQSRSGFLLPCDRRTPRESRPCRGGFQSRSGFLLPCDRRTRVWTRGPHRFNPVLGFYCPATRGHISAAQKGGQFQSRSGFLLPCDL